MAAGLIIGLLILAGGIVFLVLKKKIPGLIMTIAGGVIALFGLIIMIGIIVTEDYPDAPSGGSVVDDPLLDVPVMDGMTATEDKITYVTEYVTIIVEADSGSHPEDTVSGKTDDGAEWSTTNKDGTEEIHMKVDNKDVTAKVETKKDSDKKTNEKADAGKAAAAVSALVDTGYRKDKDNYNHNYSIWYVEPAQCLVYYPAQLELSEVKEDNTAIFTDKKSKAKLKISLDENSYSCMDDVESFIANTEYNKVLASGTDWFSCEAKGKSMTEFSYTGLGQKFAVNVDLTYENKYGFVFEELRGLIKCEFVEGGKWVSNEVRDTTGKTVPALQNAYANGIKWKLTQWYFADGDFIQIYPNIFTKVYHGNDATYFTDPVTGAYIKTLKQEYGGGVDALAIDYGLVDYTRIDEDIIRGYKDTADYYKEYHYIVVRDSLEYHTIMYVPYAYDYLYQGAAAELSLKVPGDDVGTFEMQDLYFKDYNCFVTVPLQFKYDRGGGNDYYYYDSFNGLDMHIKFWEIPDDRNTGNIFDIFDVTADDANLIVGQNTIKWHNDDGLFLGGQGNKTACYVEIVAVDAERAYLKSWDRFDVRFEEKAKAQSIVDEVKKDVKTQKIKDETVNGKPGNTASNTNTGNTNNNNNDTPQDNEKPKEEKPPIVAEATNHELPDNDEWMDDDEANVVLWYKDYDDYYYMTTTARKWFLSEDGGAMFSHNYKCTLLQYMNVILKYNEYEVNIDNAWVERNAVPAVDAILEDWYYDSYPPVGSMLGDDITSVFEAYCQVLQIEVPDYVSNAMEPTVLDEEPEGSEDSDEGYSEVNYTREDVAGIWAPDGSLGYDETYKLTKTGGYSIYNGDREVDSGWYTISGKIIYAQSFNKSGDDYELWVFDPLMDEIIIKRYGHILFRTGYLAEDDDEYSFTVEESENHPVVIPDDENGEDQGGYDNGEHGNADNGIGWTEDVEEIYIEDEDYDTPVYQEVAQEFKVEEIAEHGMSEYGNLNYIWYWITEDDNSFSSGNHGKNLAELDRILGSEGLTFDGAYSVDTTHVDYLFAFEEDSMYALEYSGYVEGHEDLGLCRLVIVNDDLRDTVEVCWMYEDYESVPMEFDEGYATSSFIKCVNNLFLGKGASTSLDVDTIWFACKLAGPITSDAKAFLSDYYNYDDDYYYVLEADESSDPQWFGATVMDKNKNVLGKCMYRWNDKKENYIMMHNFSGSWQNAWSED